MNHLSKDPPFKVDNLWAPSHPGEAKQLNQLNLINRMSFFYSLPLHPYGPCWGRICSPQDCLPAGALEACGWLQFWKKIIWDLHWDLHCKYIFWDILGISGFPMPLYTRVICLLSLPFRRQNLKRKVAILVLSPEKSIIVFFTIDKIR